MLKNSTSVITLENPAFRTYLIVNSLLILKMMAVTVLTLQRRIKHRVFISEEDTRLGGEVGNNESIERARRAFQNDLENITLFFIVSFGYLWTGTPLWVVNMLYYLFFVARVGHTVVYAVYVVRPPARGICFMLGFLIIGYMTIHTLVQGILGPH